MKQLLLFLFLLMSFMLSTPKVSAHVLQTAGTIGAVLHIDPNDDPVAGKVSSFFFEFKDTANTFQLSDCTCTIHIQAFGKDIYTTLLSPNPYFTYTFAQPNVYTVSVDGASIRNHFKPFTLSYVIRVERGTSTTANGSPLSGTMLYHMIHYGIFGLGFVTLIYLIWREKRKMNDYKKEK